jgi:DNA-binding NarL/FixJ family response regulator
MDVSMLGMSGFEPARLLRAQIPELWIVLASQHAHRAYLDEAIRLGVHGYVLKQSASTEVAMAIREALAGCFYRSSSIPA